MAIKNKSRKEESKPTTPTYISVLRHVPIRITTNNSYVLVRLADCNEQDLKELEKAPIDIEVQDGVALFNISRYCKIKLEDGSLLDGQRDIINNPITGSGIANIKLRHASYDWEHNRRRGHTDKLEVMGIKLLSFVPYVGHTNDMEDLDFDDDDNVNVDPDELPL